MTERPDSLNRESPDSSTHSMRGQSDAAFARPGPVTLEQRTLPVARTFDSLVREHKNRIHTYVCRLTNDSPDAEDLTQEVFVRAYQSFAGFRNQAAVDTWLYRIATNLVIDRYRRERRAPQWVAPAAGDEEDQLGELPAEAREADPAARLAVSELQGQVRLAIATLPPKLRGAVVLHDMEGLSYDEVATALGCPVGTVKSRLFNARLLLRRKLHAYVEG